MYRHILELVLVVLIGILPLGTEKSVAAAPAPAPAAAEDEIMLSRFQNILNHNYCFGASFDDKEALVDSASIALAGKIQDGYISKPLVDAFVDNLYGVDCTALTIGDRDGFYPVVPRGYDIFRHEIDSFAYNGDGTITVRSTAVVNDSETRRFESVLFADGSSAFGYILRSCVQLDK